LANGTIYKVYEDIVPNGKLTGWFIVCLL
jgi:hypothetical protein